MRRWVLAAAAEPQPVDDIWQRSDGVPAEIATPENTFYLLNLAPKLLGD